jgi:excisionase family DNA binding protein
MSALLGAPDAAAYIGVALQTLYNMRTAGTAPQAVKVGRLVKFREADLDAFIDAHREQKRSAA